MGGDNIFMITAFSAGLISFFSPCILPVIPIYTAILTEDTGDKKISIGKFHIYLRPVVRTLLFVFGLSVVFLALGFSAGAVGSLFNSKYVPIVMGILVVVLGLHQMEIINFKKLQKQKQFELSNRGGKGYLGAFILGLGFSLGWTPCIGPVLSAIVAISATESGAYGVILTGLYSLGLALPFIIISILSSAVIKHFVKLRKYMSAMKKIGGALVVIMGILLITGQLSAISGFFLRM